MAKFFRVATSGKTVDGREISADHLRQMAANYDRDVYGARIWIEHLRSLMPNGEFRAYGDVINLKTEEENGKTVLYAELDPSDDLKEINKDRQKIFTSVEIDPSFSDSGEAYLVGLAVTDSPASIGTQPLAFNHRKKAGEEVYSDYIEVENPFADTLESKKGEDRAPAPSIFATVKKMFARTDDKNNDAGRAIILLSEEVQKADSRIADLSNDIETMSSEFKETKTALEKTTSDFNELKKKLSTTLVDEASGENTGADKYATNC